MQPSGDQRSTVPMSRPLPGMEDGMLQAGDWFYTLDCFSSRCCMLHATRRLQRTGSSPARALVILYWDQ